MKVQLQSAVTKLSETQYGVALTAILPNAQAAVELRKRLEAAVAEAFKRDNITPGTTLIVPRVTRNPWGGP